MYFMKFSTFMIAVCFMLSTPAKAVTDTSWIKHGKSTAEYDARGYIGKSDVIHVVLVTSPSQTYPSGRSPFTFKVKLVQTSYNDLMDEIRKTMSHIPEVAKFAADSHFNIHRFSLELDSQKIDKTIRTNADVKSIQPESNWGIVG